MATIKQIQTNFSSGEIDPMLRMRVDTGAYSNGAFRLRNVSLLNAGGVARRAGTAYAATLVGKTRLIPFDFSYDERYVLALSNNRLDVYDLDGVLVTTVTTNVTWTTAQLFELTYTQVADVMIIAHPTFASRVVRRTSATTFSVSAFAFDQSIDTNKTYQPYYKFADDTVKISVNGNTGSGRTITASAAVFSSAYVGVRLRWKTVEIEITGYTNTTTLTGTIKGTLEGSYDINPFRTTAGTDDVEVTHVGHGFETGQSITVSGANAVGGLNATHLNATHTVSVIDDNRYYIFVGHNAHSSEDGGGPAVKYTSSTTSTRDWSEPVFSPVNGYPGAVAFHEGRLWFAGSQAVPDGLWSSKINRYFNFDVGEGLDDESIQITIGSEDISNVRHLTSHRDLQIFTSTGEYYVPSQSGQSITPSNIRVARQTPYGAGVVTPLPFDGATLFVQASGKAVREYTFNDTTNGYASTDVTLLASHLINDPVDMSVLYGTPERGEQYAFVVNSDGTVAVFYSARAENVAGWTQWNMGTAEIQSICVIGEAVYAAVKRGATYVLEKFGDGDSLTLDSSVSLTSGSATVTWTLGAYYASKTVAVVSSGMYLGLYTANGSGVITLPEAVTSIMAGFNYTIEIKTMPVNLSLSNGSMIGMPKRISRVLLGLDSTLACTISGNQLILRQVTDDLSIAPDRFSGIKEFFLLGYAREAQVTITQDEPLPMRILGMNMEVAF
jgi:hypothetical protein